ncbi:hypothetical protein AUC43_06980 [Hymenobacter sedentarius]|uniref:Uncharacterized protein n=1 Tax=Hymenobacter sedentarius TaxID=1411621 RepID=A0A0U4AMW1_9BACT|nr:hypothetical protein [Hymenobacter sedentarius]ALW84853.1 hypothetical protein AUC43_06980 [Hymenobacter sedentarius]
MKLRFEDNSIRLRLSEAEVTRFAETGRVSVVVPLGPTERESLTYALERSETEEFRITHGAGAITIKVPAALATKWTSTDQNGLSATLMMAQRQPLKVLVEKDLECRH